MSVMPSRDSHSDADASPLPGVEIAPGVGVEERDLRFDFVRSRGPGGRDVNKVASKARLELDVAILRDKLRPRAFDRLIDLAGSRLTEAGVLILTSDDSRSQHANRRTCLQRLRELIVEAMRVPKVRRKTKPSYASKQRRLEAKKQRGEIKKRRGRVEE